MFKADQLQKRRKKEKREREQANRREREAGQMETQGYTNRDYHRARAEDERRRRHER